MVETLRTSRFVRRQNFARQPQSLPLLCPNSTPVLSPGVLMSEIEEIKKQRSVISKIKGLSRNLQILSSFFLLCITAPGRGTHISVCVV